MGGYPGLWCVKIHLFSYRCITNGGWVVHRADGVDCRRAGLVHLAGPGLGGVTAFPAHETRKQSLPARTTD